MTLSNEMHTKIVQDYIAGKAKNVIKKELGISNNTVYRHLRWGGLIS